MQAKSSNGGVISKLRFLFQIIDGYIVICDF